jgi:hypothetical protein
MQPSFSCSSSARVCGQSNSAPPATAILLPCGPESATCSWHYLLHGLQTLPCSITSSTDTADTRQPRSEVRTPLCTLHTGWLRDQIFTTRPRLFADVLCCLQQSLSSVVYDFRPLPMQISNRGLETFSSCFSAYRRSIGPLCYWKHT